jgi:hypothetical protein
MTLEMMKELFGITYIRDDEEEVTKAKSMHVREEEVSLSQPVTTAVPPEEEEVPFPQGLRRLPLEEEDVPVPLEPPPYRGTVGGRSPACPLCHGPVGRKGMPCRGR